MGGWLRAGSCLGGALALGVVVAACGGPAKPVPVASNVITRAYLHTIDAGSAKLALSVSPSQTNQVGTPPPTLTGSGYLDMTDGDSELVESAASATITILNRGEVLYESYSNPKSSTNLLACNGHKWLSTPGYQATVPENNPALPLAFLAGVSGTVYRLGSASIAGQSSTEYRVTANLNTAAKAGPGWPGRTILGAVSHPASITMLVWVSSAGYVTRIQFTNQLVAYTASSTNNSVINSGEETLTLTLADFGSPPHIPPSPPPSSVATLAGCQGTGNTAGSLPITGSTLVNG